MKIWKLMGAFCAVLFAGSAWAQFGTNVEGGGSFTTMQIEQKGPGHAVLILRGVALEYLNHDPKISGVVGQKDVSGKGTIYTVPYAKNASAYAGLQNCMTGVGRGGWAFGGGKVDHSKVKCVPAGEEAVFDITIGGRNACAGFTFAAVRDGKWQTNTWFSHPGGPTNHFVKRGNGARDMATILCVDGNGTISAPQSPEQVQSYAAYYTKVTTE